MPGFSHQSPERDVQVIGEDQNDVRSPGGFGWQPAARLAPQSDAD